MVTAYRNLPVSGVVVMMARATNAEIYSPHNDLPQALSLPEGWPDAVHIRTDHAGAAAVVLDKVADHLRALSIGFARATADIIP